MKEKIEVKVDPKDEKSIAVKPIVKMPIRASPYKHQIEAFNFALKVFGVEGGNDEKSQM